MKIILLMDDKKLGNKHDIKEVADSYAKNVLIPKKIAVEATNENLNKLKNEIAKEKYEYNCNIDKAVNTVNQINSLHKITIKTECSKDGKMFGAVTSKDIADELVKNGIDVRKQDVILDKPIKMLGITSVKIKLFGNKSTTIEVNIAAK